MYDKKIEALKIILPIYCFKKCFDALKDPIFKESIYILDSYYWRFRKNPDLKLL